MIKLLEFEPTYQTLLNTMVQICDADKEESKNILNKAITSVKLSIQPRYEVEEIIIICKELEEQGGDIRIVGTSVLTQARCWKIVHSIE